MNQDFKTIVAEYKAKCDLPYMFTRGALEGRLLTMGFLAENTHSGNDYTKTVDAFIAEHRTELELREKLALQHEAVHNVWAKFNALYSLRLVMTPPMRARVESKLSPESVDAAHRIFYASHGFFFSGEENKKGLPSKGELFGAAGHLKNVYDSSGRRDIGHGLSSDKSSALWCIVTAADDVAHLMEKLPFEADVKDSARKIMQESARSFENTVATLQDAAGYNGRQTLRSVTRLMSVQISSGFLSNGRGRQMSDEQVVSHRDSASFSKENFTSLTAAAASVAAAIGADVEACSLFAKSSAELWSAYSDALDTF